MWGATRQQARRRRQRPFQSTLPVWGATLAIIRQEKKERFQSTLPVWGATRISVVHFVPRAFQSTLPVWGATNTIVAEVKEQVFQSTLPVWGATFGQVPTGHHQADFNPRSPCGERPRWRTGLPPPRQISIHAPRVGSDAGGAGSRQRGGIFQSTLPVWGATVNARARENYKKRFQSTLPVWGATQPKHLPGLCKPFQSTLPVWGATQNVLSFFGIM